MVAAPQHAPRFYRSGALDCSSGQDRSSVEGAILGIALDHLALGFLVLQAGQVAYSNAAAREELSSERFFRWSGRSIAGVTDETRELVARLTRPSLGRGRCTHGYHRLEDARGGLLVAWTTLDRVESLRLLVLDIERSPIGIASAEFGLTPAETQVLGQILEGVTLERAAGALGIATSTAKTHLDAIFRKSNTRRRAHLIRATLSLLSPLRGRDLP